MATLKKVRPTCKRLLDSGKSMLKPLRTSKYEAPANKTRMVQPIEAQSHIVGATKPSRDLKKKR